MAFRSGRLPEKYDCIVLSRQGAKPFIHDFHLQQNFATDKWLISLRLKNGCKKDPFYNVTILVDNGSQLAGEVCESLNGRFQSDHSIY